MRPLQCRCIAFTISLVAISVIVLGCDRLRPNASGPSPGLAAQNVAKISAAVLAADQEYGAAWLKRDWAAASALTAPNYYGLSTDLELDHAGLKELFSKVRAFAYEKQSAHVRVLTPVLAIVSYEMTMKETYDGRDISGRYWYATTWTLIGGSWKLLMEQEIPLADSRTAADGSTGGDDSSSLIGTWRLVLADDRPDKNSQWQHSYGKHPKGYLVYDQTGHVSVQFSNDPPTPPFKARDDYKPSAREAETAYVNYVAYFGTYSVDPVRHVVTHHVEGSLLPSYTSTDQERPYQLRGDTLELSDGETWRRVWVRVPPPDDRRKGR